MGRYLLLIFITLFSLAASAQQFLLTGRITDENNRPVAFTSVYIRNSTYGTSASEEGKYQFKLAAGTYKVVYRFVGFKEVEETITITDHDIEHDVKLVDETYQLAQFSRKNGKTTDSAAGIVQHVIDK